MKKKLKGNALLLTTIILMAVSIIAAGLTTYFYYAAVRSSNSNIYTQVHMELENEFNKTYEIMVKNERLDPSNVLSDNLSTRAAALSESNDVYNFTHNNYKSRFNFVDNNAGVISFSYTIETTRTMKTGNERQYSLTRYLTVESISSNNIFTVQQGEVYYVSRI